jgi:GDP-L-fucose synthase
MIDLARHRVCVTGGAGFLGKAVTAALRARGLTEDQIVVPRQRRYDLTRFQDCRRLYEEARPEIVIHLAAEVGGIGANQDHPGRFFYANMAMGLHLIELAREFGIEKFVQVGTVCAYPKLAPVPFREEDLWNGFPEETNAPYGVAKKALFVMLDGYHREYSLAAAVVVPVNLYGPGDNFDLHFSHVIPALIRKCVEARDRHEDRIICWGSGRASREFLHVDDAAEGVVRAAERIESPEPINLGVGEEITILELAETIAELTGFSGRIEWDSEKPDGQPRRRLDVSRAERLLNWRAEVPFREGLLKCIGWWESQGRLEESGEGRGSPFSTSSSENGHERP